MLITLSLQIRVSKYYASYLIMVCGKEKRTGHKWKSQKILTLHFNYELEGFSPQSSLQLANGVIRT